MAGWCEFRSPLQFGLARGTCFSLSGERSSPLGGCHAAQEISLASPRRAFGHEADETPHLRGLACSEAARTWPTARHEWPSPGASFARPGKLKHAPSARLSTKRSDRDLR